MAVHRIQFPTRYASKQVSKVFSESYAASATWPSGGLPGAVDIPVGTTVVATLRTVVATLITVVVAQGPSFAVGADCGALALVARTRL